MEEKNYRLLTTKTAVTGISHLTDSSLPSGILQLLQSAILPIGSFPGTPSVSTLSQSVLSACQQQHRISDQEEPMLLLPASALSFPAIGGAPLQPLDTAKTQQPSLQCSQQLMNAPQMPLLFKPQLPQLQIGQVLPSPQINQPLIVLPVDRSTENSFQSLENYIKSDIMTKSFSNGKQNEECKICNQNDGETPHVEPSVTDLSEHNLTADVKTLRKTKKDAAMTTSDVKLDNVCQMLNNDSGSTKGSDQNVDISQIISKLPSGWQVVGISGINQLGAVSPLCVPSLSNVPYLLTPDANLPPTSNSKNHLLTTEIKHPHDQPSLVSVNLNSATLPVTSETVLNESSAGGLTCSVKLDDISGIHNLSAKAESSSKGSRTVTIGSATESQFHKHEKEEGNKCRNLADHLPLKSVVNKQSKNMKSVESCEPNNQKTVQPLDLIKVDTLTPDQASRQGESNWAIVGITSLPPLPSAITTTVVQSNTMSACLLSSSKQPESATTDSASLSTILKIPQRLSTEAVEKTTQQRSCGKSPVKLSQNDEQSQSDSAADVATKLPTEDMRWTLVGLVGSSVDNPLTGCKEAASLTNMPGVALSSDPCSTFKTVASNCSSTTLSHQDFGGMKPDSSSNYRPQQTVSNPYLPSTVGSPSCESSSLGTIEKGKGKSEKLSQTAANAIKSQHKEDSNSSSSWQSEEQSQWKVVGLTTLGVPQTPSIPQVSLPQFTSFPSATNIPFLMTETSSPFLTNQVLPKPWPAESLSPLVVSSPTPTVSGFTLAGNAGNTSLISSASPSLLPPLATTRPQSLQDLVHQQSLSQLIQNQLASYNTPVNMMTLNDPNQWNVVGVISSNQVSLLNLNSCNPPVSSPTGSASNTTDSDSISAVVGPKPHENSEHNEETKKVSGEDERKSTSQSLISTLKSPETKNNFGHFKSKGSGRKQQHAKMKKNTVSNLLKMKRLHQRTHENGSSEEGDPFFEDPHEFTLSPDEIPPKKAKTRSLRSYAGNRKLFTRSQPKDIPEKISLRSGTQVPVPHYKSEINETLEAEPVLTSKEVKPTVDELFAPDKGKKETTGIPVTKADVHSSARRRKLKVPRKMVADLDYHPFDSSSDSN